MVAEPTNPARTALRFRPLIPKLLAAAHLRFVSGSVFTFGPRMCSRFLEMPVSCSVPESQQHVPSVLFGRNSGVGSFSPYLTAVSMRL